MSDLEWVTNEIASSAVAAMRVMENYAQYRRWRSQLVQGRPKATADYSTEQLEAMGLVGLYRVRQGRAKAAP